MWVVIILFAIVCIAAVVIFAKKKGDERRAEEMQQKIQHIYSNFRFSFARFTETEIVRTSMHNRPITAAFLFVMTDFLISEKYATQRPEISQNIHKISEGLLKPRELEKYDQCISIFGAIVRGQIPVRGDWMPIGLPGNMDAIDRIVFCYADLLFDPSLINNYADRTIHLHDAEHSFNFSAQFQGQSKIPLQIYMKGMEQALK